MKKRRQYPQWQRATHEAAEAGIVFHFYGSVVKCLLKCQMRRNIFIDSIDNNKEDVEYGIIFIETVVTL